MWLRATKPKAQSHRTPLSEADPWAEPTPPYQTNSGNIYIHSIVRTTITGPGTGERIYRGTNRVEKIMYIKRSFLKFKLVTYVCQIQTWLHVLSWKTTLLIPNYSYWGTKH